MAAQLYYGKSEPEQVDPKIAAERAAYQRDLTTRVEGLAIIRNMLKDPASAEFGASIGRVKHGQRVACGYVNARNSFGGYTGAQRWVVLPDQNLALVRDSSPSRFDRIWNRYCTGDADDGLGVRR